GGHERDLDILYAIKRDQHGDACGQRCRCTSASAESKPYTGPGEGSADEDCFQDIPGHQYSHGPDNRNHLYWLLRHFHHWRRLPGYCCCTIQQRSGECVCCVSKCGV